MEKTTTIIKNRYTLAEEHEGLESTYIPPRGCTVIYPAEDGYQKVKLGDGVTTLADLPWCGNESDLDAILEEAKAYTDSEIATFDFIKLALVILLISKTPPNYIVTLYVICPAAGTAEMYT